MKTMDGETRPSMIMAKRKVLLLYDQFTGIRVKRKKSKPQSKNKDKPVK